MLQLVFKNVISGLDLYRNNFMYTVIRIYRYILSVNEKSQIGQQRLSFCNKLAKIKFPPQNVTCKQFIA